MTTKEFIASANIFSSDDDFLWFFSQIDDNDRRREEKILEVDEKVWNQILMMIMRIMNLLMTMRGRII